MSKFTHVIIIYNPNSTGDSKKNAESLKNELTGAATPIDVTMIATKYAGHALEIAREHANDRSTVIVSSSGDGGYNEVVNGVINVDGDAATAVLPSGNANDHHASVADGSLADNILHGVVKRIETIEVRARVDGRSWKRHAHSYVGFGLTPKVGKVLTEQRPNVVTEKWHVLKQSLRFRHVSLRINGERRRYGSLIFATVGRMSKVVKLDDEALLDDGMMEVYVTTYISPIRLLKLIFTAGTSGIRSHEKTRQYELRTIRPTLVQLDGEVFTLDGDTDVGIVCHKDTLRTVL
jgi:diacylglycerol kinase (ATP)